MCDRIEVLDRLECLYPPWLLDRVLKSVNMPTKYWPSNVLTLGERSLALLKWAESPGGCRLEHLSGQLDRVIRGEAAA